MIHAMTCPHSQCFSLTDSSWSRRRRSWSNPIPRSQGPPRLRANLPSVAAAQWQRRNGATMRNGSGGSVKRCEMRERIRKNEIKLDITFTSLWVQLCSTMFNCSHSPNFDQQECEGIFETLCHWEENASWDWDYLRRPETQSRVLAGILGLFGSWFQIHSTPQADRENMTDSETKRHWVVCFFEFFSIPASSLNIFRMLKYQQSSTIRYHQEDPQLSPSFACSWWAAPLAARGTAPSALWALVHPARREPSAPKTSTSRGCGRCEIRHQSLRIGDGSKPWYLVNPKS